MESRKKCIYYSNLRQFYEARYIPTMDIETPHLLGTNCKLLIYNNVLLLVSDIFIQDGRMTQRFTEHQIVKKAYNSCIGYS